jgi:hypothetical protein
MDSASFEDLQDFMDRLGKLGRTGLIRTGSEVSLTLEWKQGQPLEATTKEPDEDTLNAFIMVLRPLLLESERTSLRRVFNLCDRHLVDLSLRERTREIRREWRAAQRVGVFKVVHNDEEWQPERLAHLVLNAYYAHDDREKRQQLAAFGVIGGMLTKQTFLHYMLDTANAASKVGAVVRIALAEGRFS